MNSCRPGPGPAPPRQSRSVFKSESRVLSQSESDSRHGTGKRGSEFGRPGGFPSPDHTMMQPWPPGPPRRRPPGRPFRGGRGSDGGSGPPVQVRLVFH